MSRSLTDEDIKAIANQLTSYSGLSAEEHRMHHETFTVWIERQNRRMEFWDKIQQSVGGYIILTILGGLGIAIYHGMLWAIEQGHIK